MDVALRSRNEGAVAGDASAVVSEAEWRARKDLAAAYRLCETYGMTDLMATHLSARVPDAPDQFLITTHGLMFGEVTASSLLKVDLDGNILLKPDPTAGLQAAAFVIHSGVYQARPDAMAVIHTHSVPAMAVASLECGLLPLTQTAIRFMTRIAYHRFGGPERDPDERAALARDLGGHSVMLLRNHGILAVGNTMGEAFNLAYKLDRACAAQIAAMSCGVPLHLVDEQVVDEAAEMYDYKYLKHHLELEWKAHLRKLDRTDAGYSK